MPNPAHPDPANRGRKHDARHRDAHDDDGDIDGKLAVAGQEFLGAIERIDEDERLHFARHEAVGALLGQDRHAGQEPRQALADDVVGRLIGDRDGAAIGLGAAAARAVVLHDRSTGTRREIDKTVEERGVSKFRQAALQAGRRRRGNGLG